MLYFVFTLLIIFYHLRFFNSWLVLAMPLFLNIGSVVIFHLSVNEILILVHYGLKTNTFMISIV